MSLTASVTNKLTVTYSGTVDIGEVSHSASESNSIDFTNGSGANQAGKFWADSRTLAASASESLDLSGGITDALGNTLTLTSVKAIRIRAAAANTNDVLVGGAAANAFLLFADATDIVAIKPGGTFLLVDPTAAGMAVTAGTGDLLKVANSSSGTGVTYSIEVVGV